MEIDTPPPPPLSHSGPRYKPPRGLRVTRWLTARLGSKTLYLILLAALIGVAGAYGAILFRFMIALVQRIARPGGILVAELSQVPWPTMLAVPAVGGLVVGPLIHYFAPEAKGHGVPEVMDAVANSGGRIRSRVAVVKILASAIGIGVGASVGREGPIVQIGSSIASTLGQLLHLDARRLRLLVGCGAAAGIAATFNAPIAGAIFALEVIVGYGTIRTFTPIVVASVTATAVSRFHLGNAPAFEVPTYTLVNGYELGLYVLLGLLSAFVAVGFSRGLYMVEDLWDRLPIHPAVRPALGGLMIGAISIAFPHIMGAGYETIERVLVSDGSIGLLLLLGLLVVKLVVTQLSLGAGFSGGVFAPSLFLGAMLGGAFGVAANALLPAGSVGPSGAYALVAMAAVVAAATHAPLTVFLIVFEMTGDYRIIVPLMLATFIASTLSLRLSRESIYTLKLARRGTHAGRGADNMMYEDTVEAHLRLIESTIRPNEPFSAIVERAISGGTRPIYVCKRTGELLGVIQPEYVSALIRDEDVLKDLLIAADIMRPIAAKVRPDNTLARCLRLLGKHDAEELPVVNAEGVLLGAISRDIILSAYDREVLQKEGASMVFTEDASSGEPRTQCVIRIPAGEHVEHIAVAGALVGRSLKDLNLRALYDVHVHGIRRDGGEILRAESEQPLLDGDVLMVTGPRERTSEIRRMAESSDS